MFFLNFRSMTMCDRPDLMRYQVYNCNNTMEVYEDRLYKCYGVFQEQGLTYTAVRRLDLPNKVGPDTKNIIIDVPIFILKPEQVAIHHY